MNEGDGREEMVGATWRKGRRGNCDLDVIIITIINHF